MDKIIHLDPYFPQTGELTVQPAVISYRGKNYVEGISKHASVGQDYFKSVVPVPGHSFVYVLAVSAWEIYGENRNGDGFPEFPYKENSNPSGITAEDVLPLHYKTFEEYGYNYRHHSNKQPEKAVGRVVKAFWNPPMHRVELLVDVENAKAPDLIERIVAGEFPPVSMGTRVPYDVCTVCLNHAPTRAQYCDHLKFNMRQVVNGIIAAALNPKCKFFDISWVFKPADTMAYMMKKVADTHSYEISGAAAGEYLSAMQQRKEAAHKLAVIDKVIQGIPVAAKGEGIDPTELGNLQQMRDTVLDMGGEMRDLPDSALQNLATHPLQKIFSTLFASGMQLSTPEVIKITIYKGYPASEIPGEFVDKSVVMQQKILELLSECPQILEMFEKNNVFNMSPRNIDPKIAEIAMPFMEKRSGIYEYLHRKVVPEQWREEAPYTTPLSLTDPATGQQYGTTRGAAIRAHDEIAKRNLYKVIGGAALLGGAYKVMGSGLTNAGMGGIKPLLGLTLGGVGLAHLPSMGPHYMTDQGIPIPTLTEMAPKQASLALPLFGTLGAMALMGHDYKSRIMQGVPVGHPALPLSRRLLDQLEGTVSKHPLISAGVGTALLHKGINAPFSRAVRNKILQPAYSAVVDPIAKPIRGSGNKLRDALRRFIGEEKLSTYLGDLISPPAGTVALAELDFDKIAEMIGEVIVEG